MSEIIIDTTWLLKDGNKWCHLAASDLDTLHDFAQKIGLSKTWFQISASGLPHYDIKSDRIRKIAIKLGAKEVDRRELHRKLLGWYKSRITSEGIADNKRLF